MLKKLKVFKDSTKYIQNKYKHACVNIVEDRTFFVLACQLLPQILYLSLSTTRNCLIVAKYECRSS